MTYSFVRCNMKKQMIPFAKNIVAKKVEGCQGDMNLLLDTPSFFAVKRLGKRGKSGRERPPKNAPGGRIFLLILII